MFSIPEASFCDLCSFRAAAEKDIHSKSWAACGVGYSDVIFQGSDHDLGDPRPNLLEEDLGKEPGPRDLEHHREARGLV